MWFGATSFASMQDYRAPPALYILNSFPPEMVEINCQRQTILIACVRISGQFAIRMLVYRLRMLDVNGFGLQLFLRRLF